jgi:8-oxo-dGTP diphosphatase
MIREYPDRPIVGIGVVVLASNKVLMIRRANPPRQGQWSLPGGAQALGETVSDAARREVLEETGLDVEILGLVDVVDSIRSDNLGNVQYHYTLIDFVAIATCSDIPIAGSDASEVAWMTLEKISGLELWSETNRIINLAIEMANTLGKS